jgi:hypothetical protein
MPEVQQAVQAAGVIRGVPLTPQDELWMEMARTSLKNSAATLNDTLQKLAALTGAMAGGLVVLKDSTLTDSWRVAVIVTLLLSLAACVRGMFPKPGAVVLGQHESCKAFEKKAIADKARWLRLAGYAFAASMLIAVVGMIVVRVLPAGPSNG